MLESGHSGTHALLPRGRYEERRKEKGKKKGMEGSGAHTFPLWKSEVRVDSPEFKANYAEMQAYTNQLTERLQMSLNQGDKKAIERHLKTGQLLGKFLCSYPIPTHPSLILVSNPSNPSEGQDRAASGPRFPFFGIDAARWVGPGKDDARRLYCGWHWPCLVTFLFALYCCFINLTQQSAVLSVLCLRVCQRSKEGR